MSVSGRRPLDLALSVVLVVAAGAAPWWLPSLAPAAVAAFVLARRAAPRLPVLVSIAAAVLSGTVAAVRQPGSVPVVIAALAGVAVAIAAADALGRLGWARARYRDQGWQLAEAVRRQGQLTAAAARTAERSRIAGEVHDSLGHDMALLAMQLSALQVQVRHGGLPAAELTERLVALQAAAAAATERLHATITLLEPVDELQRLWSAALDDVVAGARDAGLAVRWSGPGAALDDGTAVVGRTVLRFAEEAITNVTKHAPGQPLELSVTVVGAEVRLAAANPTVRPGTQTGAAPGSGRGLTPLAERVRILGGELRTDHGSDGFRLTAAIPLRATPDHVAELRLPVEHARSREEVVRRGRSLLLVPAGILALGALVLAVAFVAANLGSVLPRERFLAVSVGQPQAVAESLLPPAELPDAPQTVSEPTADCRYYEERVSFFERVTTFQICFAGGTVVSTTEIPAERSR